MAWMIALSWLISFLSYWIFITIGSAPGSTFSLKTLVSSGLLSLGAVVALLCIILLVAKMFLWIMILELVPILQLFLDLVIDDKNYVHTATSIGTML